MIEILGQRPASCAARACSRTARALLARPTAAAVDVPERADVERVCAEPNSSPGYRYSGRRGAAPSRSRPASRRSADRTRAEAELGQQQERRVELIAVERGDEAAAPLVPRALEPCVADRLRIRLQCCARSLRPRWRRSREPIARRPAHHRGERVHVLARAALPQPRVGLVPPAQRVIADRLDMRTANRRRWGAGAGRRTNASRRGSRCRRRRYGSGRTPGSRPAPDHAAMPAARPLRIRRARTRGRSRTAAGGRSRRGRASVEM